MDNFQKILKKQRNEYIAITLMILFIVLNIQVPKTIAELINNDIGKIIVYALAFSLIYVHRVLGLVALIFAYELIRRSENDETNTKTSSNHSNMKHTMPNENVKYQHLDEMNQFPVTLEEDMVNKLVPLVNNKPLQPAEYKPIMSKLHDASQITDSN